MQPTSASIQSGKICRYVGTPALLLAVWIASGCASLAPEEIARIEVTHGVSIDVSGAASATDLLGGNSLVVLWNIDKELNAFPQQFKRGMKIHIVSGLDILAESQTFGDVLSAPLVMAATQDYPGPTQGDIYVINKGLWGTYMEVFQPDTTMWQDPRLRHELMHAYEINALTHGLFTEKWQRMLDERQGELDEMTHKLAYIDSISLLARADEIVSLGYRPYVELCARWMASAFGDVNGDGLVDEGDRKLIAGAPGSFDANDDGFLTYDDASLLNGPGYSFASGIDPATQIEMTAGMLGYRPKGFASPYGRTSPWEDKAEALSYAVRHGLLPDLCGQADSHQVDRACAKLTEIRRTDPVLGRKIEILADFLANLAGSAGCRPELGEAIAARGTVGD